MRFLRWYEDKMDEVGWIAGFGMGLLVVVAYMAAFILLAGLIGAIL